MDKPELLDRLDQAEAEIDNYKILHKNAIDAINLVFQNCRDNHNPILPDSLHLVEDDFQGVVKLAKAYAKSQLEKIRLTAENQRLRACLQELYDNYYERIDLQGLIADTLRDTV